MRSIEAPILIRSRKKSIAILALLALLIAQAAAGLHALKHFHVGGDQAGLPGQHLQLCLECASFAPLAGTHGGSATSLAVAFLAEASLRPRSQAPLTGQRFQVSFRARAPPR